MGKGLLIVTLGFSTIFSGYVFHFNIQQNNAQNIILSDLERQIAKNTSETAANVAVSRILQGITVPDTGTFGDATYITSITDVTGDSANSAEMDSIVIISEYNGLPDTSWVLVMRPAFSYYQYFSYNSWPAHVQYISGDVIDGPIHSNVKITGISADPTFISKVSSGSSDATGLTGATYHAGLELGTELIPFSPTNRDSIEAFAVGTYSLSTADTLFLLFLSDGTFDHQEGYLGALANDDLSVTNGVIVNAFGTSHVVIRGGSVLNGKVTVIGDNVHVKGNVQYQGGLGGDDYLGIVARDNFYLWYSGGNTSIDLNAAIMVTGMFNVRNNSGAVNLTFTLNGSLAVNDDKAELGQVLDDAPTLFTRVHNYDERLRRNTSPYFPRVNSGTPSIPRREIFARKN